LHIRAGVVDFDNWSIIKGMKSGLHMGIVRPVIGALLVAVVSALGCAGPAQGPTILDNSSGWQNKWDKAVAEVTSFINREPKFALAYNNRGFTYYYGGEYDKAIADYNKAIELDPRLALAYNNRGLAYHGKQEYGQAIADYTRAIEIDPAYAQAYQNRASTYYKLGQLDKFADDYKKCQELSELKRTP
jgi:tetratricopeptide (TPR) repeat protein